LVKDLDRYLPDGCVVAVLTLLAQLNIDLRISRPRVTKLGDYRPPLRHKRHRISVNSGLNKYSFFITLIHEIAHARVWDKYRNKVSPHGLEWKREYQILMTPYLEKDFFPENLKQVLTTHMLNPRAGHFSDPQLVKALSKYDSEQTLLEELPEGAIFAIRGGRVFRKGPLQRTRYKCQSTENKKWYLIHKLTPIQSIEARF